MRLRAPLRRALEQPLKLIAENADGIALDAEIMTADEYAMAFFGSIFVEQPNNQSSLFLPLPKVPLPGDNPALELPGTPIKFTGTPAGIHRRPPLIDEQRAEVFADLGVDDPRARDVE